MLPNIFVSSTIEDLQYLREVLREKIKELGYIPIMSEYGDIGFMPENSAVDSCYETIKDCQIAIFIIGKRYGSLDGNISITHREYRKAIEQENIYRITFIEKEVLAHQKVYKDDRNKETVIGYPGYDSPNETFEFIEEVTQKKTNNAYIPYSSVEDMRNNLKMQLAHVFGSVLRVKYDKLSGNIMDVLSEVKAIRHNMKSEKTLSSKYVLVMRYMLDEDASYYRKIIEGALGPIDEYIEILSETATFEEFSKKTGLKYEEIPVIKKITVHGGNSREFSKKYKAFYSYVYPMNYNMECFISICKDGTIKMNHNALCHMKDIHGKMCILIKEKCN